MSDTDDRQNDGAPMTPTGDASRYLLWSAGLDPKEIQAMTDAEADAAYDKMRFVKWPKNISTEGKR